MDQERVYREQIAQGKSHVYAKAFASKFNEGEVFARHFAVLREARSIRKRQALEATTNGAPSSAASTATPAEKAAESAKATPVRNRKPQDFIVSRTLGEGSYSTVFMAREKETQMDFAMKILDKAHIKKEGKTKYVKTEKDVFNACKHPLIVKLYYTMQDEQKLYFVIEYCKNGELLSWIKKLGSFDEECARFYIAEIILALEHMHERGIIHRDLKPENILLSETMHVKITDFGTSKILDEESDGRANSFVGTAQYVSPELLTDKVAFKSSDLWAVGVILYQLLSGKPPFRGGNAHLTFQKVKSGEYEVPNMFPPKGLDLVQKLLVLDPTKRLGSPEMGGFGPLKAHPFFDGMDWDTLPDQKPPRLEAYLPAMSADDVNLHETDTADDVLADMTALAIKGAGATPVFSKKDAERNKLLAAQRESSPWQKFLADNELIIKTGLIEKRVGLFSKRRQLILTDKPRMLYVDVDNDVVKGEIPWSTDLFPQFKNMKTFFVHTPNRTYYLEDVERAAITWVDTIQQVLRLNRIG